MSHPSLQDLFQELKKEISLLHQLHVLAQTEFLVLEKADFAGLDEVVAKKEAVAADLSKCAQTLDGIFRKVPSLLTTLTPAEQDKLKRVKDEANRLLKLIEKVDSENRRQVECLKVEAIQCSQQHHQDIALRKAYETLQAPASQHFGVVE